jgi:hypothetical protein
MLEFAEVITNWRPAVEGGFWLASSRLLKVMQGEQGGKKMTKEVFMEGRISSEGLSS